MLVFIVSGKTVHDFTKFSEGAMRFQIPSPWSSVFALSSWDILNEKSEISTGHRTHAAAIRSRQACSLASPFTARHAGLHPEFTTSRSPHIVLLSRPSRMNNRGDTVSEDTSFHLIEEYAFEKSSSSYTTK